MATRKTTEADDKTIPALDDAEAEAEEEQSSAPTLPDVTAFTETVPGGRYLSADGKTYHDAQGRRITKAGKVIED